MDTLDSGDLSRDLAVLPALSSFSSALSRIRDAILHQSTYMMPGSRVALRQ